MNICGRIRTWQTVQPPSRASATARPLRCFDTCSNSFSAVGRQLLRGGDPRGRGLVRGLLQRRGFRVERLALDGDRRLLRLELRFRGLQLARQVLGLFHALEDAVLEGSDRLLGGRDLVLHGLVFLVGLELGELSLVFGQAGLDGGDFGFDLLPLGLALGEPLLDGLGRGGCLPEPRREGVLHRRDLRDAAARGLYLGVELLKPDQMLDIRIHVEI